MREDEALTRTRLIGRFNTSDDDYTDAVIRDALTSCVQQVFGEKIVESRTGTWLKQSRTTITADKWKYRLPHRALPVVESIELSDAQLSYELLDDIVCFSEQPTVGAYVLFTYYLRPSAIVQYQSAGRVTAVDTDALTVTVSSLPVDRVTAATIATGDYLDIVHPNGWHALSLVGVTSTITSTTLSFPDGTDLQEVEVGDYVRAASQSEWPPIPDEFHECWCTMTAARLWRAKANYSKADALEKQAAADIERFANMLEPRVKDAPETCVPQFGMLRGRTPRIARSGTFGGA